VQSASAHLQAEVDPNATFPTSYHFEYVTEAAYQANIGAAKDPFTGAGRLPPVNDALIQPGSPTTVTQLLFGIAPDTAYRYRVLAKNSASAPAYVLGGAHAMRTLPATSSALLADGRGWEMVSPVEKNGGQVEPPGTIAGGGVLQAAASGASVTYGSAASFAGGQGAPPASQYLATRTPSGWATENLTAPVFSGSYDTADGGVPYQLFSGDLARAILLNGDHCRGEGSDCAVANSPLPGTDAPAGYQDYYLREGGSFTALLGAANAGFLTLEPADFDLTFAGASPDLRHVALFSCAALTANAVEAPLGEGCDPEEANLYEWSGASLSLINVLPAQSQGAPGAELGAQSGAISEDGNRVYFTVAGDLYLREGATTKLVGSGASFQTASADGSVAFYLKADEHLYRYLAAGGGSSTDLTAAGAVKGVLGASASGDTVYYQDASALERWRSGVTTTVAADSEAALASDWPPATGTARVSDSGNQLLFLSTQAEALAGYDNTDLITGDPDSEVFLYDASAPTPLRCVSCNPTGERPTGASAIPAAIANGTALGSTDLYKPRVLSADGKRVFFDSSDSIVSSDTNADPDDGSGIGDVYEWEAQGEGSCTRSSGCLNLISSGRDPAPSTFIDASADGSDAFFLTGASLVGSDPGSLDLYDARVGGGFPSSSTPIPCEGDACQPLPSQPIDPTLTTLLSGPGNPPVRYPGVRCRKGFVKQKGECVRKGAGKHKKKGKGKGKAHKRGGGRR
jgi:hypothetical protein